MDKNLEELKLKPVVISELQHREPLPTLADADVVEILRMPDVTGYGGGGCSRSIPNLGQLLFKALLLNCGHDQAASQAIHAAAARRCAASLARPQTQKRPHYGAGLRLRWVAYSEV